MYVYIYIYTWSQDISPSHPGQTKTQSQVSEQATHTLDLGDRFLAIETVQFLVEWPEKMAHLHGKLAHFFKPGDRFLAIFVRKKHD